MRYLYAILIFLFVLSCNKESGYIPLKINHGSYKILKKGGSELAKNGQYLLYSMLFFDNNGKTFLDNRTPDNYLKEQISRDSILNSDLAPVSEMLLYLAKGDSAILKVPLSKERKVKEFADSDTLIFAVKVIDFMNEEQILDYIRNSLKNRIDKNSRTDEKYYELRETMFEKLRALKRNEKSIDLVNAEDGISYFVISNGNGKLAHKGQRVHFDYIGLTKNELREFDNSFLRLQDTELILGSSNEIPGWHNALTKMNEGMIAVFFIPSKKAYGNIGKPMMVEPDSDLIYLLKLNEIVD